MSVIKEVLQNAVKKLAKRAEDCFDRARIQHASADKQHASAGEQHASADRQHASADKQDASATREHSNADKLVTLGVALEADAIELNDEIEMCTARSSPHMEVSDGGTRTTPNAIPY
jgi:hypothetical protein